VPSDNVAVAVNWEAWPAKVKLVVPLMATAVTVGDDDVGFDESEDDEHETANPIRSATTMYRSLIPISSTPPDRLRLRRHVI
jgi:hypothetical protein